MSYGNPSDYLKNGDKIKLVRRYSNINGYSIKQSLDGVVVTVTNVEDSINGAISFIQDNGETGLCFQDAFGSKVNE